MIRTVALLALAMLVAGCPKTCTITWALQADAAGWLLTSGTQHATVYRDAPLTAKVPAGPFTIRAFSGTGISDPTPGTCP